MRAGASSLQHMLLRRLAGVLTAACMLHLSVVASDAACGTHMASGRAFPDVGQVASDATDMDTDMAMDAVLAAHPAPGEDGRSRECDTPVQPDCCRAVASCAQTFAAPDSAPRLPAIEPVRIPQSVMAVPLSELVAPDTPPPKA